MMVVVLVGCMGAMVKVIPCQEEKINGCVSVKTVQRGSRKGHNHDEFYPLFERRLIVMIMPFVKMTSCLLQLWWWWRRWSWWWQWWGWGWQWWRWRWWSSRKLRHWFGWELAQPCMTLPSNKGSNCKWWWWWWWWPELWQWWWQWKSWWKWQGAKKCDFSWKRIHKYQMFRLWTRILGRGSRTPALFLP